MGHNPDTATGGFRPRQTHLLALDSDGCVFDSMELKHKECFIPEIIRHFGLQPVARFAREAAEFVNLYSCWRGTNRFPALVRTLDLLRRRPEVRVRGVEPPRLTALERWLERETRPSNATLDVAISHAGGAELAELLRVRVWSDAVNAAITATVVALPPFPHVREVLAAVEGRADALVVSATPTEALEREWREHELDQYVAAIGGQEHGTKSGQLRAAVRAGCDPARILMVGDAPGDRSAADAVGALFYPVVPGREAESWQRLREEALERFLEGRYAGEYAERLVNEFDAMLPEQPPWALVDEA